MATEPQHDAEGALRFLIPVVLIVLTVCAYANSFDGPFVLDDIAQLVQRKDLQDLEEGFSKLGRRPVGEMSFRINGELASFDGNTGRNVTTSYHVVNLLIHILAGLTLYGVIRRTLRLSTFVNRYAKTAAGFAGAVALLWLVHPLQTQSVTYMVQRYASLMGLFYLLTFYCSIRAWELQFYCYK